MKLELMKKEHFKFFEYLLLVDWFAFIQDKKAQPAPLFTHS